jgi:hypothetical protein
MSSICFLLRLYNEKNTGAASIIYYFPFVGLTADDGTTVDVDSLATDERSITGSQEHVGRSQLGRLTDPSDRRRILVPFLERVLVHGGFLERSPDGTRGDGVDSDTLGEKLVAEASDHGDLGTLGHCVVEEGGCGGRLVNVVKEVGKIRRTRSGVSYLRGGNDDVGSLGHVRNGGSSEEESSVNVGLEGKKNKRGTAEQ